MVTPKSHPISKKKKRKNSESLRTLVKRNREWVNGIRSIKPRWKRGRGAEAGEASGRMVCRGCWTDGVGKGRRRRDSDDVNVNRSWNRRRCGPIRAILFAVNAVAAGLEEAAAREICSGPANAISPRLLSSPRLALPRNTDPFLLAHLGHRRKLSSAGTRRVGPRVRAVLYARHDSSAAFRADPANLPSHAPFFSRFSHFYAPFPPLSLAFAFLSLPFLFPLFLLRSSESTGFAGNLLAVP